MSVITVLGSIAYYVLLVFVLCMWVRFVIDLIRAMRPGWRPHGAVLVFFSVVIAITNPPLKLVRRIIKPVAFGGAQIDFAWTIVLLVAVVLMYVVGSF